MAFESVQNRLLQRAQSANRVTVLAPYEPVTPKMAGQNNPFLISSQANPSQNRQIGVNKPFYKPMFLGYYDDQPLYGGSRLFVLG